MTETTEPLITPELDALLRERLENFTGNARELESAVGALLLGRVYGWKVLRVVHGSNAYAKYERYLDLRFRDWCADETPLSRRSKGYQAAEMASDFWDVVAGKLPGRSPELTEA